MKNKLVILDLDETLIRSEQVFKSSTYTYTSLSHLFVYERPFLGEFLEFLKANFFLAVWTSASRDYAESILNILKLDAETLVFFNTRDQCLLKNDDKQRRLYFTKDTNNVAAQIKKFDSVFFIDDSPDKIIANNVTIIPIKPFLLEENDTVLLDLINFFKNEN